MKKKSIYMQHSEIYLHTLIIFHTLICSLVYIYIYSYISNKYDFVIVDCDVTDDCFDTEVNTAHQQAQVGNLKLDLPLDEDDYLMPSPQLPTNTTQYMDLIGDTKPTGK